MEHEKEIVLPPYLKEGDKVALVSPAYWIPQESIQEAAETVKMPVRPMSALPTSCGHSKTIASKR